MLISIGRKQETEDLLDLLMACHARIRSFSALAVALSEREGLSADEVVDACDRVSRYFSEALPLHARDEEESLLPRLMGRDPALDAALTRMRDEHGEHRGPLQELLSRCAIVRAAPTEATLRAAMAPVARDLRAQFEAHLWLEESVVFPAVRARLSQDERRAVVAELRARRGDASTPRPPPP